MKVLCVGHRDWAIEIYKNLKKNKKNIFYLHKKKQGLINKIKKTSPDVILFYGWSWIIKSSIYKNYNCLMLHPSKLPKYRGGSPIQNQIIRGVKSSAVTIFKINKIIDGGDIYFQKRFSLDGTLEDIFKRIVKLGIEGTNNILLKKNVKIRKQNHKKSTYYKRREPSQSEITASELRNKSKFYLINKLRMLSDPYPNPYIKYNGKKIIIKKILIQ